MTRDEEQPWFLPQELKTRAGESPNAVLVGEVAAKLWAARKAYLARLPVQEIVEILDRVVAAWIATDSPWMAAARHRIAARTPYSEPMVETGIRRLLQCCRRAALLDLLKEELGDPGVLDGFRPRPAAGGLHRACGPSLTTHIFSGNVPGLPAIGLIHALLVKSACLGKPASEEPVFPALFARSIAAVDAKLGSAVAILPWPGGDRAIEQAAFGASEAVVASGNDSAIENIRSRVPLTVRFVGHGHKLSFAVIGRESLDPTAADQLADRLAYDVSLFDQQGCVSPHLVYVERGGGIAPQDFAERLAMAMASFDRAMPRGLLTVEEAAAIQQARATAEFGELRDEAVRLFASQGGTAWTVIYEDDPAFTPSCLNRVVRVKPVSDLADVPGLVRPFGRHLQSVGTALGCERRERLAEALAPLGVCRICPIGEMPHPPLPWHHDGGQNLLPLLRWVGIEG
jgi:hypothetical protein